VAEQTNQNPTLFARSTLQLIIDPKDLAPETVDLRPVRKIDCDALLDTQLQESIDQLLNALLFQICLRRLSLRQVGLNVPSSRKERHIPASPACGNHFDAAIVSISARAN
jgi:hypothetical protein